ncbi:hypothetical protein MTO96_034657 [Rhipicephalus appendiculatus]
MSHGGFLLRFPKSHLVDMSSLFSFFCGNSEQPTPAGSRHSTSQPSVHCGYTVVTKVVFREETTGKVVPRQVVPRP